MPEFALPVTAEQWADVEVNVRDCEIVAVAEACEVATTYREQSEQRGKIAAASRLLAFERCVKALAKELSLATGLSAPEDEARRILEGAK